MSDWAGEYEGERGSGQPAQLAAATVPDPRPGAGWFLVDDVCLREYRQSLDLRGGVLTRHMLFEDEQGRRLTVDQHRLVHMADPHLGRVLPPAHDAAEGPPAHPGSGGMGGRWQ